ncbi:MAG: NADH-quinone oxidoreductase subunit NuoE [Nocardioidaceae bacterium]
MSSSDNEATDTAVAVSPGVLTDTPPLAAPVLAALREIAGRYPHPRSALLPMLHLVQAEEGYVTPGGIEACAQILAISAAEVSGVATFYTMYKRRPVGDYHVGVCTNTLCAVMGGDVIFKRLQEHLEVGNDETTPDGRVTLEHIECNAACDYAPVMTVNWEFMDNQTPESAVALVEDLRAGRDVTATRGARICTWREAERVLAGFPDDRADEGPAAGPASLVGLVMAREHGWQAPDRPAGGSADRHQRSGRAATAESATGGAAQADTARAEGETHVAETSGSGGAGKSRQGRKGADRKDAT